MKAGPIICFALTALLAAFCARSAWADLYWETESVSTNLSGKQTKTSIQKYYFTPRSLRVELGGSKVYIVDYDAMELHSLDTRAKTCTDLNLTELPGLSGVSAADKNKAAEIVGAMMAIQVTPTDELKTIAGYRCRRFNVRIAIMNGEYWVSEDVAGYRELKSVGAKVGAIAERNPMLRQVDVAGMVEKLGGFPVYTVNHLMGETVASTLRKIEQKSLDPALFVVPEDYAVKKSM
ncbi:MAG TPA: DUF4412 domain-containing protein [Syntrophobacteraceae bacterium]|nr:DUF4412 domain-containing protein [Syntrophobacteraceae bacterium]